MTEEKTKITTRKRLLLSLVIATLLGGGGAAFYHYQTKEVVRFVKVTCAPMQQLFQIEAIDKRVPDQQTYVDNLPADVMQQMRDGSLYLVKDVDFTAANDQAVSQITAECEWEGKKFSVTAEYLPNKDKDGAFGKLTMKQNEEDMGRIACWHGGCSKTIEVCWTPWPLGGCHGRSDSSINYGKNMRGGDGANHLTFLKNSLKICQGIDDNCAVYNFARLLRSPFHGGILSKGMD